MYYSDVNAILFYQFNRLELKYKAEIITALDYIAVISTVYNFMDSEFL